MERKMDEEKFNEICVEIQTTTKGLNTLCKERNSSAPAFFDLMEIDEKLSERYVRARSRQAEYIADLINEEAFNDERDAEAFVGANHVNRSRLKIDTLKWTASKLLPKKYGDKLELDNNVSIKIEQPLFPDLTHDIQENDSDQ